MTSAHHGIHLKLENLRKSFHSQEVLRGIDLEVLPGQFVAIVGRSGCGKSTLLRLISSLVPPTEGNVLLDGQRSQHLNSDVRMMFQDSRLLPWQRVIDNVELGLIATKHKSHTTSRQKAREGLVSVGLGDRGKEWPAVLSGGQQQRVSLARALVSEPRLLLLDEPLGALDALTRVEMQSLLERLWQEQKFTAFLITHDVEEAVVLADRVVLIEDGQIALDISVDLPRPRQRGNAVFAKTVETLVQRVLGKHEQEWSKAEVAQLETIAK
ncbi:MAG: ATP-binding cassette domain-containing protein [Leptolyngbya sp. UWPOB_LEPTO1]|uniref:ATP-binding cassette domain-containing protein n=1 Tax=Leptolyngbya sp. UWPOB_LEPTO1 TaxID=2815653 RepID=UPI001ACBCDC8|nr:ATP-binding cassette domain-containing protein [Leptolyngbya sp. UWPOB_LEPTO1]MBN8564603.1 ATP-binding cassette domain-containing protein [Leptolyngbya sp. UWPOB_LEPTO1]